MSAIVLTKQAELSSHDKSYAMHQVHLGNVQTIGMYKSLHRQNILRKVILSPLRIEPILWSSWCRLFLLTPVFQPGQGQFLGENMTFIDTANRLWLRLWGKTYSTDLAVCVTKYIYTHTFYIDKYIQVLLKTPHIYTSSISLLLSRLHSPFCD